MPNRILKESICTSPNITQLSRDAEVFFYRLIVQCDDFGRMDARLPILRAKCYPLQIDVVSEAYIATWLHELVDARLILVYSVDGMDYLQMQTWERHQQVRAKRSKYPSPPGTDSTCNQLIADDSTCPRNPIQSNPNPIQPATDFFTVQDKMIEQWRAVLGDTLTPAILPDVQTYMQKLWERGLLDWWMLALKETTGARRPGWQYLRAVLESWLASGKPSTGAETKPNGKTNGAPSMFTPEQIAIADRKQAIYDDCLAEGITDDRIIKQRQREAGLPV